jgi:viologen exporter family transport system permease protein
VLYAAVAARSFRRFSTYRAATLAGIFTNSVFGIIYSYAYIELWTAAPDAGGYDVQDAVTYVWIGQSLLMTVAMWSGGTTDDLTERIRTGDVAIDLYRPVPLLWWYYAADLGRATYHFLSRGLAPSLVGLVLFGISPPASPIAAVAFLVSVALAVTVSFAIRFLVATTSFWVLDSSGIKLISGVCAMFLSGLTLPLNLFPGWFGTLVNALPWASFVQVPIDVYLGQHTGTDLLAALAFQVMWAVVLLAAGTVVLARATRKVVVQGG